jgi:hypothetical protein
MANEFIARRGIISLDGAQITGSLSATGNISSNTLTVTNGITGTATSASYVEYSNVAGKPALVSGSSQISFNGITDKPTLVSGSSQITYSEISSIPSGIVSSSTQVGGYNIFATTGSNTFQANQIVTGSLFITQNLVVAGSSSIQYISSSVVDIADNIITVNAFNPGVRFGGLAVADSGSSPRVSGSILFDSIKDQWIFVHESSATTSSVILMGPETYNDLGNETYLSANRLPKGSGIEHLRDSNISDTGTVVSVNSNTQVTGSLNVSSTGVFSSTVTSLANNISADGAGVVLQGYVDNSLRIAVRGSGYNDGARGGLLASTGDFSSTVTSTGNVRSINTGVDGTFADAFVGVYNVNNNEQNSIQTSVSSAANVSGFRFQASNGGGSAGRTTVVDFLRDRQLFYTNVGIGTTTPGTRLEVSSTAPIGDRTLPHNILTLTAEQGNAPYGGFGGAILFKNRSYISGLVESSRIRSVIYDDGAPNNFGGGLWFETTPTPGGTLTPSIAINYQGRVGIGTITPKGLLDVRVSIDRSVTFTGTLSGESIISSTQGDVTSNLRELRISSRNLYFNTGDATTTGTQRMTLTQDGNVGIGTTDPGARLHISDATSVTRLIVDNTANAAAGAGVYFRTYSSGTLVSNATVRTDNAGNFSVFNGTSSDSENMRIASNGSATFTGPITNNHGALYSQSTLFLNKLVNVGDNTTTTVLTISQDGAYSQIGGGEILIVFVDNGSPWGVYVWKGLISVRTVQFGSMYGTGIQEISSRNNLDGSISVICTTTKTGGVSDAVTRVQITTGSGIAGTAHVSFNGYIQGGSQPV